MGGKTGGTDRGADLRRRAAKISLLLREHYPDAACALRFTNPLELLVATVLSAQCTDTRVNEVTKGLFSRYGTAADYARADPGSLMEQVRPTGFFRNKARSIIAAAQRIEERFGGEVPGTMEDLLSLPGVGRKTANVILGNAFGTPGIVVDTHVGRVSRRLGLTAHSDPVKAEYDLAALFPRGEWTLLSHRLIAHGRKCCKALRPRCPECFFGDALCPSRRDFL